MRRLKLFLLIILCIGVGVGAVFLTLTLKNVKRDRNMIYGVSFNTEYAYYLGFDIKTVFNKILDEWNFRYIRLSAQWNLIEKNKGQYDWRDLDWLMDAAAQRNAKVILAVGHKTPRWPECHAPDWVDFSKQEKHQSDLKYFMQTVVERYKNHPALEIWQVENEPFLRFGECESLFPDELAEEIGWVKHLDPNHPVIVTDSGELSTWWRTARATDLFGTTLYRVVWNKMIGYFSYDWILPPIFSKAKLWFNRRDIHTAYITELQAEPWIPDKNLLDTPIEEQYKSMNLQRLQKNIVFAEKTGMPRAYLWGAEWWYWLETKGETAISSYIKELIKE